MKQLLRSVISKVSSFFLFKKKNDSYISKQAKFKKCDFLYCIKNTIKIGSSTFINCRFSVHGSSNKLIIGDNCLFNNVEFYLAEGSSIIIGNNTRIFGYTHLASCEKKMIEIGSDCLISSNVNIRNTDSHSIVDMTGNRLNYGEDVIISDHVWVCNNVTILKGTRVNKNSIIGNSSLVNKPFQEENVIICGVPASIKKAGISWLDKRI